MRPFPFASGEGRRAEAWTVAAKMVLIFSVAVLACALSDAVSVHAAWFNASWSQSRQFNVTWVNETGVNYYPVIFNFTGLSGKALAGKDVRITNESGAEFPSQVIANTTDSAQVVMLLNLTQNASQFRIYWSNPSAEFSLYLQEETKLVYPVTGTNLSVNYTNYGISFEGRTSGGTQNFNVVRAPGIANGVSFIPNNFVDDAASLPNSGCLLERNGSVVSIFFCSADGVRGLRYYFFSRNNFTMTEAVNFSNTAQDALSGGHFESDGAAAEWRAYNDATGQISTTTGAGYQGVDSGFLAGSKTNRASYPYIWWNYTATNGNAATPWQYARPSDVADPQWYWEVTGWNAGHSGNLSDPKQNRFYSGIVPVNNADMIRIFFFFNQTPTMAFGAFSNYTLNMDANGTNVTVLRKGDVVRHFANFTSFDPLSFAVMQHNMTATGAPTNVTIPASGTSFNASANITILFGNQTNYAVKWYVNTSAAVNNTIPFSSYTTSSTAPAMVHQIQLVNRSNHQFNASFAVDDADGASTLVGRNISFTSGTCSYLANATTATLLNLTYNCSGTGLASVSLQINVSDSSGAGAASSVVGTAFPNLVPAQRHDLQFVNHTGQHSFNVSYAVDDNDGASEVAFRNISTSSGACSYVTNATSGTLFNVTFNCSGTALTAAAVQVNISDGSNQGTTSSLLVNSYPNNAPMQIHDLQFANFSQHSFNASFAVEDDNGNEIAFRNISATAGACSYYANATSGRAFNVTYNCTGAALTAAAVWINLSDAYGLGIQSSSLANTYPNSVPAQAHGLQFVNYSGSHQFNVSYAVTDNDGGADIAFRNVSSTSGACGYLANFTSGALFNATFNCTGTGLATARIQINVSDNSNSGVASNELGTAYPDQLTVFNISFPFSNANTSLNWINVTNVSDADGDVATPQIYVNGKFNQTGTNVTLAATPERNYVINVSLSAGGNITLNQTISYQFDNLSARVDNGSNSVNDSRFINVNSADINYTFAELFNSTIYIRNGSGGVVTNTSPVQNQTYFRFNFTALNDGNYTFSAWVNDTAGNVGTTNNISITVDTTLPVAAFNPPTPDNTTYFGSRVVNISFSVTDDNFRNLTVAIYNASGVLLNNTWFTVPNSSLNYTLNDANYTVNITAYDQVDNSNTSINRHFTVDVSVPVPVFNPPTPGNAAFVGRSQINISFNVSEANFKNLTVRLYNHTSYINDTWFTIPNSSVNYTLNDMNYTVNITAYDQANNSNTSTFRNFTVDATAPVVGFGVGSDANSTNLSRSFIYVNITVAEAYPWNLTAFLKSGSSVSAFLNVTANATPGFNNVTFSSVANGRYNVSVYVQDLAGNINFSENRSFIIDTDVPSAIVYVPAPNSTVTGSGDGKQGLALDYSVSDNSTAVSSCWYKAVDSSGSVDVQNSTLANCGNMTYLNVSKFGTFTLTIYANDSAGNLASNISVFTVAAPRSDSGSSSGGGGGGGRGGGGGAAENVVQGLTVSRFYDEVGKGEVQRLAIDKAEIALASVAFTAAEKLSQASISVKVIDGSAAPAAASGSVYQYLSIETANVGKSGVASAEMFFKVEKQWLEQNGLDEASVILSRYEGNAWVSLSTSRLSEESSTHFFYRAVSQGFSFFAITASVKPQKLAAEKAAAEEGPEQGLEAEVEKPVELRMPAFAGSKEGSARGVLVFSWLFVSGFVFAVFAVTLYLARGELVSFANGFVGRAKGVPNVAKLAKAAAASAALFFHRKAEKLVKQKRTVWAAAAAKKAGLLAAVLRRAKLVASVKRREAESAFSNDTGVEIKMKFKAWPKNKQGRIEVERGVARDIGRREGYFCVSGLMKRLEQTYPGQIRSNQRREIYQEIKEWIDADELCVKSGVHKNVQYYHFL